MSLSSRLTRTRNATGVGRSALVYSLRARWAGSAIALGLGLGALLAADSLRPEVKRLSAVRDFQPVRSETLADYYAETRSTDPAEHGVAIQTQRHRDRPAAAEAAFGGTSGHYDLTLLAVAEDDGESTYRLSVAGRDLGEHRNPPQIGKRTVVSHRWSGVALDRGTRLRVTFAGHTNGRIPEDGATAWSRGRWRALLVEPSQP